MRATASVILLLAAALLLGADGQGIPRPPLADEPKAATRPKMTREEAIRELEAAGYRITEAHPGPGVEIRGGIAERGGGEAMELLPLVPDTVVLDLKVTNAEDDDFIFIADLKKPQAVDRPVAEGQGRRAEVFEGPEETAPP